MLGLFERGIFERLLDDVLTLLRGSFCLARLEAFEETVGSVLLALWRRRHCRLHCLLLVEILHFLKHDALHGTRRCPSGTAEDKRVIFGVARWFWRQIQNLGWMPILHNRVVRNSEIARHQAELTAFYPIVVLSSVTSGVWLGTDIIKQLQWAPKFK